MFTIIMVLISLFSFTLCDIRMNGYTKDTFTLTHLRINSAWLAVKAEYFRITEHKEDDVFLYPIALYRKFVNGINYKIFFAAQIRQTNDVNVYDYVAYCQSVTNDINSTQSEFDIVSTTKLIEETTRIDFNRIRYRDIMNTLIMGGQLFREHHMIAYQHFLGECGIYIIYGIREKGSFIEAYIVFEDEEERCKKIAQLIDVHIPT